VVVVVPWQDWVDLHPLDPVAKDVSDILALKLDKKEVAAYIEILDRSWL
jgi:hypothetical protein